MHSLFFDYQTQHEKYFMQHGQKVTYKKGQYIVSPVEESSWVHFLVSGTAQASFSFTNGSTRLIGMFIPGMSFAKSGAFFKDSGGDLEYVALENVVIYRIPQAEFFQILATDALFNQEYMGWLLKTQILLIERIVYQGENTIERKTLRWLLFMAKFYGIPGENGVKVQIPMTHETIANFLHATRESISKTIKRLQDAELIHINKKVITIPSLEALHDALT